ncbi:MAG: M48 family metalloprotease [Planctomycetota bacterium]|jgi:Zn-dependent protease with chaperone function|nr:M48 family metalloprotease [Planctomycetota bacterium]
MSGPLSPLVGVLLAILIVAAAESGLESETARPGCVVILLVLPHLAGGLARTRKAARGRLRALVAASPAPLFFVAVAGCGWRAWAAQRFGGEPTGLSFPGLDVLVALAPFGVLSVAAIDASARLASEDPRRRGALRALQLRVLLLPALPLVALVFAAVLLGCNERLLLEVTGVGLWYALFGAGVLCALTIALPALLRLAWSCEPLPAGPLRTLLERTAAAAGFRFHELCVWHTGGLVPNALIAGLLPRTRVVLLSDALLAMLEPRELLAVFAHEMGHAHRKHTPLFLVMSAAAFMAAELLATAVDPDGGLLALGLLGAALAAWAAAFGWLSRRAELDADLFAEELTGGSGALRRAFTRLGAGGGERSSWRHFSAERRVAFLERADIDPSIARALRARLRAAAVASAVVFCVSGALHAKALLAAVPAERVVVELRLGRHARALKLARGSDGLPADADRLLATLAAAGPVADHPDRRGAAAACRSHAEGALEGQDPKAAGDWLRLAELAGDAAAGTYAQALEWGSKGRWEPARAAVAGEGGSLARALQRWLEEAERGRAPAPQ